MIVGIILRNFKIYKNITFIPISTGGKFCAFIGKNGAGKSSIFEALDFFFNNSPFNTNISGKSASEERYVVPIFAINKTLIPNDTAEKYSNAIWELLLKEITTPEVNNSYLDVMKNVSLHIKNLDSKITKESHYLLPIGMDSDGNISISIFRDNVILDKIIDEQFRDLPADKKVDKAVELFKPLLTLIKQQYQYVYIPKDIEPERLLRFETSEIQTIIGYRLVDIVSKNLPPEKIKDISKALKELIDDLSAKLPNYQFKVPQIYQPNLKADNLYTLIIHEFFSLRELHKVTASGKTISLSSLSSGEKQQAILTVIYYIISKYRLKDTDNLIIAVDEPESSLHISACYEQFEQLYDLSRYCCQVMCASHWYGFIPAISSGCITNIVTDSITDKRTGFIFNIEKYREEIKLEDRQSQISQHHPLLIDIMLKSTNDFVQSIFMSVINVAPYNWLICEGSSDKIYLDAYLKEEVENYKLRIVPVCTASEVKKTYQHLAVLFNDLKARLIGKVLLLTDTDNSLLESSTEDGLEKNLMWRRLVNDGEAQKTRLVKVSSNPKSPKTDIEDTLNGNVFNKTLLTFKNKNTTLSFIDESDKEEIPSYFAMNLRPNQYKVLDTFLNANNGKNKFLFAKKYVSLLADNDKTPSWINEIKKYFAK